MSDVNRNKLRELATGCRDEVIRSHGWEGTIEEAELIARDRRLLMELSPEVVIQLLDDYDALLAERDQLRAQVEQQMPRLIDENHQLRAELAAIRGQEPVGHQFQTREGEWRGFTDHKHYVATVEDGTWPIRAIYALPPQQPDAWPKLDKPAKVGAVRFCKGISTKLVVEAAQRYDEYCQQPEVEAERLEKFRNTLRQFSGEQPDAVSVSREQSDVPLYAAINRACGELPEGWYIELNAERDGAWVALLNAELEVVDFPTNNERLDYTVNDAVEFALLSTRQAEEGE